MFIQILKSKIHRVKITQANIDYIGSITIHRELMQAANIIAGEKVQVLNASNGERLETYVMEGEQKGEVCINGPAALKMKVGDVVIIISYAILNKKDATQYTPTIIFPNELNNSIQQ